MDENNFYSFELRQHQLEATKALNKVDKLCNHHNIKYFLIAGSALGAVRHKGFIPWDDDIDIGMQLKDYNGFLSIVEDLEPDFSWSHTDSGSKTGNLCGRILLNGRELVTIFPIVKISNNRLIAWSQWLIRKTISPIYQRKLNLKIKSWNIKQVVSYCISSVMSLFFTEKQALKILRWNEKRFEQENTTWTCNIYSKYSFKRESIRTQWIDDLKNILFEDDYYPTIRDYHAYLTHLYGDYMTLPPKNKRHPEHIDLSK